MRTLIIDNKTLLLSELKELLSQVGISNPDLINVEQADFQTSETYDLVVLTGAKGLSVPKHPDIYKEEFKIIRERTKPLLGICAGFQAIAFAYGCTLHHRVESISGIVNINVLAPDLIFSGRTKFTAFESHKYFVSETPPELIQLAKSEFNIEVIKHILRPIYGFQFHPEATDPQNDGAEIFKAFIEQNLTF
jgi:GMP synthase-like glutamine amidotransferase